MDISVIIPVYNVEKYITRCLDSIFQQQFSGTFEVIAVDDFSTDNSLQILYNYQKSENRLIIIEHEYNKKLSCARTSGIKASSGNYIMQVDSDDWILPNTLENLHNKFKESEADIIVFNYMKADKDGKTYNVKQIVNKLITKDIFTIQKYFFGATVNKIVKSSILNNLIYSEIGINSTEDLLYSTEILLKANKVYLTPEFYYVYFTNNYSLTNSIKSLEYITNQKIIIEQLNKIIIKYNANRVFTKNLIDYFEKWIFLELTKIQFLEKEKLTECIIRLKEYYIDNYFPHYRIKKIESLYNNKYLCLFEVIKHFGVRVGINILITKYKILK